MTDRIITAQALITAKDGTGDVFARIGAKLSNIGHSAKSSKAVGELCDKLDAAALRLKSLDKLQANMAGFAKARLAFNESKAAIEAHARAMKSAEKPTAEMERKYTQLQSAVSRAAAAFEKQKTAMLASKKAAEDLGSPVTKIAAEQARLKSVIDSTTHAIERQSAAERHSAAAARHMAEEAHRAHKGFGGGVAHGLGHLSGVTGLVSGYGVVQGVERGLETYREFDKERRYQKAVMRLTDEQQEPLIRQAIEGGATSRYNDIQWLESQRELAARGLNRDQVLAITGVASNLGMAMDRSLPEASKALEGGMFGFGKDTSTYEKALANAKRTADLQVRASKISGMDYDDIVQAYKYGAAPFRMAGLSEEQLLAFAGVGKKANMGGDEMGVAARALAANLLKPTSGARTAMLANGINYSDFQKQGSKPMDVDAFAKSIAAVYGVSLSDKARSGLAGIFADKSVVADASKYMPAVMKVLEEGLGKQDAKSKKSIAGEARRYRDASMAGVDAPALFDAIMQGVAKNPALANAIFGSKQGARIRAAIGDPAVFLKKLDELQHHSEGAAPDIAKARMAGYDGAMYRLTGAIANLQTAFGRAFDNGGKGDGGLLTYGTKAIAGGMQAFVDAPAVLQRLTFEAGAAATAIAGLKALKGLTDGFGLSTSAGLLEKAAISLQGAAVTLKGEGLAGDVGGLASAAGGRPKKTSVGGKLLKLATNAAILSTVIEAANIGNDYLDESIKSDFGGDNPFEFRGLTPAPRAYRSKTAQPMRRGDRLIGPALDVAPLTPHYSSSLPVLSRLPTLADGDFQRHPHAGQMRPIDAIGPLPSFAKGSGFGAGLDGHAITATVQQPIPVDVTGKVQLQGQANVTVAVKVTGPGEVTGQYASSSGNIKVSTGASMPGAKTAAAGSTGTK